MGRLVAVFAIVFMLAGCDILSSPPKLPELPPGAEELTGDGAWESAYDNAVGEWLDQFEDKRPFAVFEDYWLKAPVTSDEVFKRYDEALPDWSAESYSDSRGRWVGRLYRNGGRMFAVAIFLKAKHGAEFDILRLLGGPKRWYDPQQ